MLTLNQDRTKFYFVEASKKAVVEFNLKTWKKKITRIHKLTSVHDRVMCICSFKSKLYGVTSLGFIFLLNTVQDKVLCKRKLEGSNDFTNRKLIAREGKTIVVADSTGYSLENYGYSEVKLLIYDELLNLKTTHKFEKQEIPRPPDKRKPCLMSSLILVPAKDDKVLLISSYEDADKPISLFFIQQTEVTFITCISNKDTGTDIYDIRYYKGYIFIACSDRKVRRICIN